MTVTIEHAGLRADIGDVLVDTGAARTVLAADAVAAVGIVPTAADVLRKMHGIGGTENVYTRTVEALTVGDCGIAGFVIQVGGMDYGFAINGILGMDFLTRTAAVIHLGQRSIEFLATE